MYDDKASTQICDIIYLLKKAETVEDENERLTVLRKAYLALDSIIQYEMSK